MDGWIIALWFGFLIQCLIILALLRFVGVLARRLPSGGLPPGSRAPRRKVIDATGQGLELGGPARRPRVLVFVSPSCPACDMAMPEVASFARAHRDRVEVILVTSENGASLRYASVDEGAVRVVSAPELADLYRVPMTPFTMYLDEAGIVRAGGVFNRREHLEKLTAVAAEEVPMGIR